jgi:serine/threonine protein kinase
MRGQPVAVGIVDRSASFDDIMHEAQMMGRVRPHANVMTLKAVLLLPSKVGLVMDLAHSSLARAIWGLSTPGRGGGRPLAWPTQALPLMIGIAKGVAHLHASHVVHRDLKPANILLTREGTPKVADFGFSKAKPPSSVLHTLSGTPMYTAPEVLRGEYTAAADVWSVAMVLQQSIARLARSRKWRSR